MESRQTKRINKLKWDLTAKNISESSINLITEAKRRINEILDINTSERTFNNTIFALEEILADFGNNSSILSFYSFVSSDSTVRKTSTQAREDFAKFTVELGMNVELYQALKVVSDIEKKIPLTQEEQRLLNHLIRDFRRNGLDLDSNAQEELKNIKLELATIQIQFSQTLNNITDSVTFSLEELEGVPQNTLDILKKDDNQKYIVGMSYPEALPVLEYGKNPETRKKVKLLYSNRGVDKGNTDRLEKAIQLRHRSAKILNYPNHASFIHEIRMAKSPETVSKFLNDLKEKLSIEAQKEIKELIKLKNAELGSNSDGIIHLSDWRYYMRMYKETHFSLDNNEIKQFFPLNHALDSMMNFYQEIFDLVFTPVDKAAVWHEDVQVFQVSDRNQTDQILGQFYLDLFPREGKFSHAAAFSLIKGRILNTDEYQATASAMVANLNKPTATSPSLLSHQELVTLFHEFGHIIHQVITKARYHRFSGTAVKRDFVEAPSQMLENWVWEPVVLQRISKHIHTGQPLPDALIQKMINAKNANIALLTLRQIFFAIFDLTAHTSSSIQSRTLWNTMLKEIFLVEGFEETNGAASFGHMLSGYDAGYYGYLWSQVYAQDMYTRFQKEGPMSKNAGKEYRKWILEPGGSMEEEDLLKGFLGRETNNKAFLQSLGIS